jgi:hypothetical protein
VFANEITELVQLQTKIAVFDFEPHQVEDVTAQCELLRWIEWDKLSEDTVSLPIDKIVVRILKE